ncbi:unnamed protein product [Vicia faba]|uniref:Uncharacterized protein n=1 Tax=Vicia faba TaxID=3906 RepID=A0AAV0YET2_VICFA|nr:unnamed protein product [Vicia faba]
MQKSNKRGSFRYFIDCMPKDSIVSLRTNGSGSQLSSQNSKKTQLSPAQRLLSSVVVLPLGEIIKPRDIIFCTIVAKIRILVASPFRWCYRACHLCPCIARGDTAPFDSDASHSTEAEIFRYKIEIQAGIDDPLESPLALDQLLNLEMAFKVKWQLHWNNCSVMRILRNEPFIRKLKAPWDIDEEVVLVPFITFDPLQVFTLLQFLVAQSVDEAKTGAPEEYVKETDLEITSKHNPDPMTFIGKREFPGGSSESTTSEGFCNGELSFNKFKKTIKPEKSD